MNLNYYFNYGYFDEILEMEARVRKPGQAQGKDREASGKMKAANERLTGVTLKAVPGRKRKKGEQEIYLKTTWPGLLIGIGNPHDVGKMLGAAEDAVKLGFTFDYVTGQPVIPGSSVKGVLRSAFSGHPDYIRETLAELSGEAVWEQLPNACIRELEDRIFGNSEQPDMAAQDIFFQAIPVRAGTGGKILGEDFITSHRGSAKGLNLDGLVEPNPVRMLKVLPEVVFAFRFRCRDTVIRNGEVCLEKELKIRLFSRILQEFGVGAKTNVGFGGLAEADEAQMWKAGAALFESEMELGQRVKEK